MREYREVRKDLNGDDAAAPYIGLARTMLGQLKNRMRLGGLAQLERSVTLPDGTTIRVASRHGQDFMQIVPVTAAGRRAGIPTPVVELPPTPGTPGVPSPSLAFTVPGTMTFVGECDDNNFNGQLALWRNVHQVFDPGYPPDANAINDGISTTTSGGFSGVSDDGSVAVGTALLPRTEGSTGFRYTKAGGFQLLGGFGSIMDTFVSGVSGDGNTISAMTQNWDSPNGYLPSIWKRSTGLQSLPAAGALFGNAWAVSKSGDYLCGQLALRYTGQYAMGVARWHKGVLTILEVGVNNDVGYGVANNGMVVGARSGGANQAYGACYWTPQGQAVQLLPIAPYPQSSTALDVTPDGSMIVGVTGGANNPASGGKGGTPQVGARAWYWTKAKGVTYLGLGVANVVSPDGSVIGGSSGAAGSAQAAIWTRADKVTMLPLVGAAIQGCVSGIGFPDPKTYTIGS